MPYNKVQIDHMHVWSGQLGNQNHMHDKLTMWGKPWFWDEDGDDLFNRFTHYDLKQTSWMWFERVSNTFSQKHNMCFLPLMKPN
jgi:hypothetical protein